MAEYVVVIMSSKERRAKNEADYDREYAKRQAREGVLEKKFGALEARLEELGVDPFLLAEYVANKIKEAARYGLYDE